MFDDLKVGLPVHYMQATGPHLEAEVTRVGNDGVVDLRVKYDGGEFDRKTVVYREVPVAYSWHFISDQCPKQIEDTGNKEGNLNDEH